MKRLKELRVAPIKYIENVKRVTSALSQHQLGRLYSLINSDLEILDLTTLP